MKIKAIARRWGNSLAIVIPKELVDGRSIRENEAITIEVETPVLGSDVFGMLHEWDTDTQELKDEMRKGWVGKLDRGE